MKLDDTVMVQFFGELIESYRQQIMDQEEARELSKKKKKFLADLRKELELPNPASVQDGDRTFWMHVRHQPDQTGTALYTGNKGWNTNPKTGKRNRGR